LGLSLGRTSQVTVAEEKDARSSFSSSTVGIKINVLVTQTSTAFLASTKRRVSYYVFLRFERTLDSTKHSTTMLFARPLFAAILALSTQVTAKKVTGINCQGSGMCTSAGVGVDLDLVVDFIKRRVDDERSYCDGENIGCVKNNNRDGRLCAFFRKTNKQGDDCVKGRRAKELLGDLLNHGCGGCGSVPIAHNSTNNGNVNDGMLTVNYVTVRKASPCDWEKAFNTVDDSKEKLDGEFYKGTRMED
jgi:hypothetical protein